MTLRRRERRKHRVAEVDVDVGALRDQQRVVARLLVVTEEMAHLRRGLQVELLGLEAQPVAVVAGAPGLHAEQGVVRLGVLLVRVVAVVRREQRQAERARDPDQLRVDLTLLVQAMVLQLDEEALGSEDVAELPRELERALVVTRDERLAHRAAEAAARRHDPLAVPLEELEVHPGLVVVAVEVRRRRELDEVVVAGVRRGQDREVEDVVVGAARAVVATRRDEVRLGADDRLHPRVARGPVEVEDAVHVAVVGDPDRGLAVGHGSRHDLGHARRTVEHRVLGVEMEVDERLLGDAHAGAGSPQPDSPQLWKITLM